MKSLLALMASCIPKATQERAAVGKLRQASGLMLRPLGAEISENADVRYVGETPVSSRTSDRTTPEAHPAKRALRSAIPLLP